MTRNRPPPAQTSRQTRAVAYIRVSKDAQELSPEAQRAGIERWAVQRGVQVTSWHVDAGVHGGQRLLVRPGLHGRAGEPGGRRPTGGAPARPVGRDPVETAMLEREPCPAGRALGDDRRDERSADPEGALLRTVLDGIAPSKSPRFAAAPERR